MILPFKINDHPVTCPGGWEDLTLGQVLDMEGKTIQEQLSILTGVDLSSLGDEAFILFAVVIEWLVEPPDWTNLPLPQKFLRQEIPFPLGSKCFGQKLYAQDLLTRKPSAFDELIGIYFAKVFDDKDIDYVTEKVRKQSCIEAVPVALWLRGEVIKLMEKESKLLKSEATNEEKRAGLKNFDKFGSFNLIDTLAGGDILKHDEIYKQTYDRVFLKLYRDLEVSNYQRKLTEIYSKK